LFGGLYGLKRGLMGAFAELGHRVDIGIGHTPLAALALARARENCELPRWPTTDGLRSTVLEALRRISLRHTELDTDSVERFSNMGIDTLGQVFRLPTAELGRRFGPKLLDYLDRISGKQPDPRIYVTPTASFSAELNLLQSISSKEALSFPMQRLAQDLGNWLVGRQLGVERIGWHFAPFNSNATTMEVEFASPQQSKQGLLAISRLKLDALELPDEILSIRLVSVRLAAWQPQSSHLFARIEGAGQSPTELVDRFKARLGDDVCTGIMVNDDHRPELAWRTAAPGLRTARTKQRMPVQSALRRPLELLSTPKPVRRRHLALLRGPERIDAGWWTAADVHAAGHRDYFVARHTNGSQCWVFVDPHGDWFIHGYFS
jgi:protein ImuB